MKKILSFILVICMLMTVAPVATFAQSADFTFKPEQATYTAKVGETVTVPFLLVPKADTTVQFFSLGIEPTSGLTISEVTAGKIPVSNSNGVNLSNNKVLVAYDYAVALTSSDAVLFTVKCTSATAGTYSLKTIIDELYNEDYDVIGNADNVVLQNATLTFKADASAGDPDFDKFKAKGVYYEATSDFENTGVGSGMYMDVSPLYTIYDVSTEDGIATLLANIGATASEKYSYKSGDQTIETTVGEAIKTSISNNKAVKASGTFNDSAYSFVDYAGKHAMYGINKVATRYLGNWKHCLDAPNMYWMIDADYFAPTDSAATFVIQYFDNTGAFTVRYAKQGGTNNVFTVNKGGTNTWVTKAFQVEDARLNKGLTGSGLINGKHAGRFECGSETYISKFAVLKTADYNDIMGIVPEVPELPSLEENLPEDASAFLKNSTLVAKLDFDCGDFTKGDNVTKAVDGLTGYKKDDNEYFEIAEVSEGNLVGHLYRANGEKPTNRVNWKPAALIDAPYMVLTYKANTNSTYDRIDFGFDYKNIYNGGVNYSGDVVTADTNGLPMILKNSQFNREGKTSSPYNDPENTGCDNTVTFEANKYQSAWHTYTYLVDAIGKKAYLFVDGDYLGSLVIYRNRNHDNYAADLNTKYLSGVNTVAFAQDWSGGASDGTTTRNTYYDDIMIRRMSAEQYAATFGADTVEVAGTSITTAEALPTKTKVYGIPVVWTTNNADVTVGADGSITVKDATVTYEDVVFTASFAGNTRTFTLDVMKQSKYAEYTFGAKEDKAYGMTSYNVAGNFYTQTKDGLTIRNSIVKFDEPRTFYYIVDDLANPSATAASHEVSKEEYDACELKVGTGKQSYKVKYYNTSAQTGDSAMNRYDAVGPDGDKRAAVWGVGHLRNETKLTKKSTSSMIHFDTGSTFSATDNALVIEVDVLNVGKHAVKLQYCNKAGAISSVSANLTNSGEWVTLKFELTDANFAWTKNTGLGNNKQDMRFQLSDPTYISAVRIYDVKPVEIADADYTKIAVADYDVIINEDNTITAKTAITAEEAADAKLYVAFYNAKGDLVGVATSAQVTDGVEQTVVTGKSVGATYNTVDYTLKTFVWDADLKPLR